jgi:oxygen-independent coproporphyrinogen-3 oxidase
MSGLYVHIPYCRQACNYCDFHFRAFLGDMSGMLRALQEEMRMQKNFLGDVAETIYFGGGTPSLLTPGDIGMLLGTLRGLFPVSETPEITLEANPDDLNPGYLRELRTLGFNRLSIGVQSFDDTLLRWMNRRHDGARAEESVREAFDAGFDNVTIDLIYGLPGLAPELWSATLDKAFSLGIQHLSAYHLTIEPRTVFGVRQRRGASFAVPEEDSLAQFRILRQMASDRGWDHYEISNLCLPGYHSRHNTGYWQQKKYLGIGPSAHSYDGTSRRWNISNNREYIARVLAGECWYEGELLSPEDRFNEYVLTSLRTRQGIDPRYLEETFPSAFTREWERQAASYRLSGHLITGPQGHYCLTEQGMFLADRIASDLFATARR